MDLAGDHQIAALAETVNSRPGLEARFGGNGARDSRRESGAKQAAEPSDEQLAQILKTAEELSEKGYSPYACVVAWGGLEGGDETTARRCRVLWSNNVSVRPNHPWRRW